MQGQMKWVRQRRRGRTEGATAGGDRGRRQEALFRYREAYTLRTQGGKLGANKRGGADRHNITTVGVREYKKGGAAICAICTSFRRDGARMASAPSSDSPSGPPLVLAHAMSSLSVGGASSAQAALQEGHLLGVLAHDGSPSRLHGAGQRAVIHTAGSGQQGQWR